MKKNVTRNTIKAKVNLMVGFAAMSRKMGNDICKALGGLTDDNLFGLISLIQNCAIKDVDKIMSELDPHIKKLGIKEGEVAAMPYIDIQQTGDIEIGVRYPEGNRLATDLCEGDYGTYCTESVFYTKDNDAVNLTRSEIKKGALAKSVNRPEENEDIDIYVWTDAFMKDYTNKHTIEQKDIRGRIEVLREPVLELKRFHLNPEWKCYTSSMLLEQGKNIATSTWEYKGETIDVNLSVTGEVRVIYKDRMYTNPTLFPLSLRSLIKENPNDWTKKGENGDETVIVVSSNRFEYVCGNKKEHFTEDVSKAEPRKIYNDMKRIAQSVFQIPNSRTEIKNPKYVLEGYNKTKRTYVAYAKGNNLQELKEWACDYIPCEDWVIVSDAETNEIVWDSDDILTFRLYVRVKFNRPVTSTDSISIGGFNFDFNGNAIAFDFLDTQGSIEKQDSSVVEFELKNPDYETFSRMGLLTKEHLENVTSINEIHMDVETECEEDEEESETNRLYPVETVEGTFVIVDKNLEEIPIPALDRWTFQP